MTSTNSPITESEDPAPRPTRRRFSPEYKLRVVAEYDAAPTGEKGAILRRERLYHSHIVEWRAARDAGAMTTLTDRRTSPLRAVQGRRPSTRGVSRPRKPVFEEPGGVDR